MPQDDQTLYEKDPETHIARITFNRPAKLNAMTLGMYQSMERFLDDAAEDDDIKVVILRGADGIFTAGQDLSQVYNWYDRKDKPAPQRRPSQRRRLVVDRKNVDWYHRLLFHPKATIAQVESYALGGGLEFMMSCDLSVVGQGTKLGMPAARFLGPSLGDLHLFFHRLGPVLAKDLLLTGRTATSDELAHLGVFTRYVPADQVAAATEELASVVARMPADGIVIAKEAYRLVEESMGMALSHSFSYFLHAFATNLQFEEGEFNFVRTRASNSLSRSFDLVDEHFGDGKVPS
jgi:enoyl-CoA hydratase/carnithine racemase